MGSKVLTSNRKQNMTQDQIISGKILAALAINGGDIHAAIDAVLGAGTYLHMAEQIWLKARAA